MVGRSKSSNWNSYRNSGLAFRKRFLIIDGDDPNKLFDEVIGDEIFATAGSEPAGRKALTLEQCVEFMLGRKYKTEPYPAFVFPGKQVAEKAYCLQMFPGYCPVLSFQSLYSSEMLFVICNKNQIVSNCS